MGPARTITVGNCSRAIDVRVPSVPVKSYLIHPRTFGGDVHKSMVHMLHGREKKGGGEEEAEEEEKKEEESKNYRVRITAWNGKGAVIRNSVAFNRPNWNETLVLHGGRKAHGLNILVHGAFQPAEKCISIIGLCADSSSRTRASNFGLTMPLRW